LVAINRIALCSKGAVWTLVLGYCFINFSFLESQTRQFLAFGLFGLSILFAIPENFVEIRTGRIRGYLWGLAILLYTIIITNFLGTHGIYGQNKFQYFLFVGFIGFISFPPVLKYSEARDLFCKALYYSSLLFCLLAIFFAQPEMGRRSEIELNPAILARLCMVAGIYVATIIYYKGISWKRISVLLLSITAVFFTATKTPVPVFIIAFYLVTFKQFKLVKGLRLLGYSVVVVTLGYLLLTNVVPEQYSARILDPQALSWERQSTEGNRYELYQLAAKIIPNHIEGTGFGGFATFHSFIVAPHNIFLEAAIELGLLAGVLLLIWSLKVIRKIRAIPLNDINSTFLSVTFVYFLVSFLFGGELTIQCLLLYIIGTFFLYQTRSVYFRNDFQRYKKRL